jgi:hypothetical protein
LTLRVDAAGAAVIEIHDANGNVTDRWPSGGR